MTFPSWSKQTYSSTYEAYNSNNCVYKHGTSQQIGGDLNTNSKENPERVSDQLYERW